MDAIALLKEDHANVLTLFDQLGAATPRNAQDLTAEILAELDVHANVEEEIFYPAVAERADEDLRQLVSKSIEEHKLMKKLVTELDGMSADAPEFAPKLDVLQDNVDQHIAEEEAEMLPRAEEILRDRLTELGRQMARRKRELMQSRESVLGKTLRSAKGLASQAYDALLGGTETPERQDREHKRTG